MRKSRNRSDPIHGNLHLYVLRETHIKRFRRICLKFDEAEKVTACGAMASSGDHDISS